jgi:hypothetical protein
MGYKSWVIGSYRLTRGFSLFESITYYLKG